MFIAVDSTITVEIQEPSGSWEKCTITSGAIIFLSVVTIENVFQIHFTYDPLPPTNLAHIIPSPNNIKGHKSDTLLLPDLPEGPPSPGTPNVGVIHQGLLKALERPSYLKGNEFLAYVRTLYTTPDESHSITKKMGKQVLVPSIPKGPLRKGGDAPASPITLTGILEEYLKREEDKVFSNHNTFWHHFMYGLVLSCSIFGSMLISAVDNEVINRRMMTKRGLDGSRDSSRVHD
ncbi:hypothetical protein BDM02DRAFT_3193149 [Thelephora ganbajun]|uniref:Uncharacterized protein n=1 Tax=Thelephora ganbajun TaxID=370292 RepID=A0ACB6YZA2_THEGA|nr:hypothetical protein BDM02DRAFT_3193149 [Thelephora ganbajun]